MYTPEGDQGVPYQDAQKLYRACSSKEKEIKLVPDSGHTFGTAHPFREDEFPEPFRQVIDKSRKWFEDYLQ
ncbi:MAG: alpha/beta hydrolase [Fodinibius sp.]|nr:alpha/beta hydrolase [Fodinibius sp.]